MLGPSGRLRWRQSPRGRRGLDIRGGRHRGRNRIRVRGRLRRGLEIRESAEPLHLVRLSGAQHAVGVRETTGIKVNVAYFDTNETLETKLLAGHSGYDVVVPTASYFERQIKAGVYLPLDKAKLPNLKNMDRPSWSASRVTIRATSTA